MHPVPIHRHVPVTCGIIYPMPPAHASINLISPSPASVIGRNNRSKAERVYNLASGGTEVGTRAATNRIEKVLITSGSTAMPSRAVVRMLVCVLGFCLWDNDCDGI